MEKKLDDTQLYRYERKFIVPKSLENNLTCLILNNPANFSEIYSRRNINNIYLDTLDFTCLKDNISGLATRKKVRLRWYGSLYGQIEPTLEFKIKSGLVGRKETFKLPSFSLDPYINIQTFRTIVNTADLPENIRNELLLLDFTLLNSYSRQYFLSFCKNIRLTVDTSLHYFNIKNYNDGYLYCFKDESSIIELKYINIEDDMVTPATNYFPFRLSKNSKYVNGVTAIRSLC